VRATQAAILFVVFLSTRAHAAPLQYLTGAGEKAAPVVTLTWGLLIISIAVVVIIGLLLAGAIWRRPGETWTPGAKTALKGHAGGLNWLWVGVGISTLVLLFSIGWTVKVLADIQAPPQKPAATIEITGRQWWWQVRYLSDDNAYEFVTANEIHIPVGAPVRLKLVGGDVIHSFWVPQLAGKMDAIPGQTNETWIEASAPGTYRGQCTEYCGLQHSHMGFLVVAQPAGDFRKWWDHQLTSTAVPTGHAQLGQADFQMHCGNCHTVRGTEAAGALGPDLSHLMQRSTIAAGQLPNNGPVLAHWIADPQSLKPGSLMPAPSLSETELADIHAYLKTLD
jgi:cytochrome c oxidase subunit 2